MAVPRVFISSTYYDLKEVRNIIGNFVANMGYEAIMHERTGVAYTQDKPLEEDCYHELASCDIVVCVIGSKFGSKSSRNELSVTMNEIQNAIKHKKKVYIFIAKDVFIENRTYEKNKDNTSFKSAYTDDLRIHAFILELRTNVKIHVVESFETTDDIVRILKNQFAGLFQNLLARDASVTESKTVLDLDQTAVQIRELVDALREEKESFFTHFDGTIFTENQTLKQIKKHLGMNTASFYAKNVDDLDDFMTAIGFLINYDLGIDDERKYVRQDGLTTYTLTLKITLFDENGKLKDIRNRSELETSIIWEENTLKDDDLPF